MGKTINTILNLQDKFSGKLSQAQRNALIFKSRLQSCEGAAKSVDKSLSVMGKTAVAVTAAGIAAMTAFTASSVKTYGEFQKSMSNVAGILSIDQTSDSYKRLESAARDAGKTTTKTASESADALSYMALAGWSTEDSIKGLMPVLRASEATGADLATTSDLITDSMSALGLQTKDLQSYLDICARAQNKSNTTLTQMQEAYIGVGGTFKTFGTSLQESGALLGILANRGIKGSEAGTHLQSTLINLTKQSGESAKAMAAIGVSAYDSEGKFKGITNVLKEVQAATADMTEEQRNTYLTMIAGKTQLTTLNALLSGLSATTSDGTNEFQALYDSLGTANGALETMADTMTNNYSGALARANSAVDDLKITIGKSLEPYITQFLNWFAEKLPGAAEKFALWLDTHIPKAVEFCKKAFDKIKPVITFAVGNFKSLASVFAGVVVGLKAFSIITKVVSLMNKLKTAETALKAVQILLNTSMLACPLTWVAAAIGAVVGGFLLYKSTVDKIEKADVASHFGDIALSAEECGKMVENVFGNKVIGQVNDLNSAWDRLETHFENLSDSAMEMNKLTFQVEMSPENVSKDEYLEAANKYIEDMQTAIKDKQFELVLDVNFLFGKENDTAELLNSQSSGYWSQVLQNAQDIGDELVQNIAKGYENGWDEKSMEMVAKSLEKMSEIQEKIQKAQAQSQMELLTADFKMGDLSQESFTAYIEKLQEQGTAITEAAKTAASNAMAAQKLMLDDGAITPADYDKNIKSITEAYETQASEASNTVLSEGMKAIREVYGKEFDALAKQLNEDMQGEFVIDPKNLQDSKLVLQKALEESMDNAGITSGVKKNIKGYLDTLMPTAEEVRKMSEKNPTLWKTYGDTLTSFSALETLTGSGDKMGEAVINSVKSSKNISKAETAGRAIKEAIIKPFGEPAEATLNIKIKYGTAVPYYTGSNNMRQLQSDYTGTSIFSKIAGKEANSRETKSRTASASDWQSSTGYGQLGQAMNRIGGHATGTPYFGGGLTQINEHGGEIINLPTGAQIIPSDKSAQMVKENAKYKNPFNLNFKLPNIKLGNDVFFGNPNKTMPINENTVINNNGKTEKRYGDINVTINVEGGRYDTNEIANEIGSVVCERIVEMIEAV